MDKEPASEIDARRMAWFIREVSPEMKDSNHKFHKMEFESKIKEIMSWFARAEITRKEAEEVVHTIEGQQRARMAA